MNQGMRGVGSDLQGDHRQAGDEADDDDDDGDDGDGDDDDDADDG